jgi:hypothetical protein
MDYLVMDNFLFDKKMQKALLDEEDWRSKYKLD